MATNPINLPAGFTLDEEKQIGGPILPQGFSLDADESPLSIQNGPDRGLDKTDIAWSKVTGISESPSPFEDAVDETINQIKNLANAGTFGLLGKINEDVFRPKGLSPKEELKGSLLGGEVIGGAVINGVLKGVGKLYNIPMVKDSAVVEKAVGFYKKAVKPKIVAKSKGALDTFNKKVSQGLDMIFKNKKNLQYIDDTVGRLPNTVDEAVAAASQTKKKILNQYTNLRKAAGQDATIDMRKVAKELVQSQSGVSSTIANPQAVKYAIAESKRLAQFGDVSLDVADDIVRKLNAKTAPLYSSGKAFAADDIVRGNIDIKISNIISNNLDDVVTKATGEGYRDIKRAYGSVVELEKNFVAQAAKMSKIAKGPNVGVVDTVPIIYGAFTGNTPLLAAGIVQRVGKATLGRFTDPDFLIKRAFSILEKSASPTAISRAISMPGKGATISLIRSKSGGN